MLSDRSYMRPEYGREKLQALPWLLAIFAVAFVIEIMFSSPEFRGANALLRNFILEPDALLHWRLWTLLTYSLVNDVLRNIFFAVFALAGLYVLGRELEPLLGPRRLLTVFLGALLLGALAWTAVNWRHGGMLFGFTPGLYGLLFFYACVYPDEPFRFLLFFFLPITIRPRKLVLALLVLDVFALVLFELAGGSLPLAYAPSAHLGGMAAGWLCHRLWRGNEQVMGWRQPITELLRVPRVAFALPRWLRRGKATATPMYSSSAPAAARPAAPVTDTLRTEVDRILDKINAHGFGALTPEEKRTLDEAKNLINRR
ncbi:MAG: rhomboid family intramembrane serine protease [Verrucomicrobiota bacterium]